MGSSAGAAENTDVVGVRRLSVLNPVNIYTAADSSTSFNSLAYTSRQNRKVIMVAVLIFLFSFFKN